MRLTNLKYAFVFAALAAVAPNASATFLTCSETVNSQASVSVEQFPSTLSYDLTVTEAWCVYCATRPANEWCHEFCPGGLPVGTYGAVETETDPILASFSGAPIAWTPPPRSSSATARRPRPTSPSPSRATPTAPSARRRRASRPMR